MTSDEPLSTYDRAHPLNVDAPEPDRQTVFDWLEIWLPSDRFARHLLQRSYATRKDIADSEVGGCARRSWEGQTWWR